MTQAPEKTTSTPTKSSPKKPARKAVASRTVARARTAGTPTARKSIPWDEIRKEFVEGWEVDGGTHLPNMRELSERFDVGYVRIREKSAKERWMDRRQAYQAQVIRERQKKRAIALAGSAVEFDEKAHNVAKLGIAMVTVRLAEISQEVGRQKIIRDDAIARQEQGLPVDAKDLWSAVRYKELEGLASAAERFQSIGMRALGTDVQKHEITGADGGPIESTVAIVAELNRDDPERLAMMIQAMTEAGLTDTDIMDADVIEDEPAQISSTPNTQEEAAS